MNRMLWTHRTVAADRDTAWAVLCDLDRWPEWGPSVRAARLDPPGVFEAGATGTVTTVVGPSVPFRITDVEPGRRWAWSVAGVAATAHTVDPVAGGTRVGFGVPWWAPPYLLVCTVALGRIARIVEEGVH